jgi:D-ribulokinase
MLNGPDCNSANNRGSLMLSEFFLGVDVGTGSARAGIFDEAGKCLGVGRKDILIFQDGSHIAEQSGDDIWASVCVAVRTALREAGVDTSQISGIGFDATCSLVVVKDDGAPLPIGDSENASRNIIVWMDHRATDQAKRINTTGHDVLRYVGGQISPEMETPKLLWLKENKPDVYEAADHFFDLTDYLTWRATGDTARSTCTVTCKWTYLAHEERWDASFFEQIGLGDLAEEDFKRIGQVIVEPGTALGSGLTKRAAKDFDLPVGTPVAAGLIDAHAGGIGTIGARGKDGSAETRMGYVFGTSACTMSSTAEPAFVPGVWGPYYSAMVPGLWLNEGGQSAAGSAIAHLLAFHPASAEASQLATAAEQSLLDWLVAQATRASPSHSNTIELAGRVVVVPEFIGNRSPLADPDTKAIIAGLGFEHDLDSLLALYIAGISGLGYGLRQIIETQRANGVHIDTIVISGGAGQSRLVRQLLADATGVAIAEPGSDEPVILGAAMLGAVSCKMFDSISVAMQKMSTLGEILFPVTGRLANVHEDRYKTFKALQSAARRKY